MRILIVEDEPEIVRFLTLELQHEGYETESCPDGKSGLECALGGGFVADAQPSPEPTNP